MAVSAFMVGKVAEAGAGGKGGLGRFADRDLPTPAEGPFFLLRNLVDGLHVMQRSQIREEPKIGGRAAAPQVPAFSACAEEAKEHAPELRSHRAAPHHPPLFHAAKFGHPTGHGPSLD